MKLLHTADWHIGQLFHEYDRTYEHQQFLNWLVETLTNEQIDVLLISGDVFDLSNPSANALKMFYTFLNRAVKSNPALQIVVTAGNHDSASRLESPTPLLESSNIHIVGLVEKDAEGNFVYGKLTIPLKDKQGNIKGWCLAIPFLRMGDYPVIADCENPYTEGVTALYKDAYDYALENKQPGQAIIAMGHLHAQQAEITEQDKTERLIMGGVECISASAFHEDIKYVALGHIHKAQRIGGKEHVRYCGSPLPMSFSEINYNHQVIVFELNDESITALTAIAVPVVIPLLRSPAVHSKLTEVITALEQLPNSNSQAEPAPYLEVRVLLDGPEPALRHKVETSLAGKHVRLAKIDVRYASLTTTDTQPEIVASQNLNDLQPLEVFSKVYQSKYNNTVPPELLQMFNAIAQEATLTD
ncbi:exonuclease SbcCD subunit D [Chitinophaga sancti]|uniref:Nuclease SbcCD subunit D n=1 Tax=Chitinophaga sancti TaxID=1004 RepID=A0A1K1SYH5_9BACT|nr:exonuclease SbcCD subunit D C-terminal domain-containing protein [Chitinophaga sancti]WQD63949.1 exonuclease SbcCD subunit D C-terminal domain-containing protein [Chitinophaga sancti]WQG90426.1 exonuclease SbcCD subunit D C-terminal domain-containing protein [Chitinophaga sancti]SFW89347.1 Exodeoxyribonuclease I subunit D [Chitinophaga sancti]